MTKVAVVGGGYIGAVLGGVLADKGCLTTVIDINSKIIHSYKNGISPVNEPGLDTLINKVVKNKTLSATQDIAAIKDVDVILLTVGTPLNKDGKADLSAIKKAINAMSAHIRDKQLIIIKSTVPPGTTEELIAPTLKNFANVFVAFCPERLAEGNAIKECNTIPVIVGGIDKESSLKAASFWENILKLECIILENPRSAELVKLADNSWIDLNIAIASELAKLADKLDVDILPIIKAANTLPKGENFVNILLPSVGVGGYCLTKDPWFLDSFARANGSEFKTAVTSREVNDQSPIYASNRLSEALDNAFPEINKNSTKIGVLGLSFKNDTGDCRSTPTLPALNNLNKKGYKIVACDPFVSREDLKIFKNISITDSIEEVLKDAHALAFFSGHSVFHKITIKQLVDNLTPGAVIFDGRIYFSKSEIQSFKDHGFCFKGIGR
jgi:UDP-N-acetyl-D-mannosaminuronic acid dehydrogenase